jgi:hypothetical protein
MPSRIFPLDFLLLLRRETVSGSLPLVALEARTVGCWQSRDCKSGEKAVKLRAFVA